MALFVTMSGEAGQVWEFFFLKNESKTKAVFLKVVTADLFVDIMEFWALVDTSVLNVDICLLFAVLDWIHQLSVKYGPFVCWFGLL